MAFGGGKGFPLVCRVPIPRRDEGGLHLADGIVDRVTGAFVEDLEAEQLGSCHGAVLVRACEGHVERQDLVRVPRGGQFVHRADVVDLDVVQCVDRRAYAVLRAEVTDESGREDGGAIDSRLTRGGLWLAVLMSTYSHS